MFDCRKTTVSSVEHVSWKTLVNTATSARSATLVSTTQAGHRAEVNQVLTDHMFDQAVVVANTNEPMSNVSRPHVKDITQT